MVSFELGKKNKERCFSFCHSTVSEVYQNQISIKTSFFKNNVVCDFEFTY